MHLARLGLVCAVAACSGASAQHPASSTTMTLAQSGIVPEWLDRSADPCTDFFQYACGGFLATAQIPPDRASWSAIDIVVQDNENLLRQVLERAAEKPGDKLGDFYAACMDEDAVEKAGTTPLAPALDAIAKVKDGATAARAVIELQALGISPFFTLGPTQDFGDATQVIAGLDQDGLGLPDRDYYLSDDAGVKAVRDAYRAHVGRMFALLGAKGAEAKASVDDVMRIETALARAQQDRVARRDPHVVYHKIDLVGLEAAAGTFPWEALFGRLALGGVSAVTVNDPAYYAAVAKAVATDKPAALRHYLTWMVAHADAPHLTRAFADEDFRLDQILNGVQAIAPRWRRCVQRTDEALGELLGQAYVAARFTGQSKPRAVDLTKVVLAAMDAELDKLPWMDDPTRAAAKHKLAKMAYLVGYPDKWRRYDFGVTRDDYAANIHRARSFEQARRLAKIGRPVDRFDWLMTPPTVNAYYEPTLNELALPAGQLQPPFFAATFHPAVNFGSAGGGTVGHEMTHGFDDEGRQFDADGNLRDWWSKQTADQFVAATQCVVDQYGQYEAVPGIKLNGKLTAGENIADIGGVKLGFQAYQAWKVKQAPPPPARVDNFTDEQLYFLGYGQSWCSKATEESLANRARTDPHSPPRWRVNGVVADQPGFAAAFRCTPSPNACSVW
jgi:predicted metalloendopeptidase